MKTDAKESFDAAPWKGPTKRYDIIKEGTIALVFVVILTIVPVSYTHLTLPTNREV